MAAISRTLGFVFPFLSCFLSRLAKSFIEIIFKWVGCWQDASLFVKNHSLLCMEDLEFILCAPLIFGVIFLFIFGGLFLGFFVHHFGVISLQFCLRGSHMST